MAKTKKAVKPVKKVVKKEKSGVQKPEAWDTTMHGQDHLNFLADHFPEVKKFLES